MPENRVEEIESLVRAGDPQALHAYLQTNFEQLLTPEISACYRLMKPVDFTSAAPMPRLIAAWFAFLSGDNAGLFVLLQGISAEGLAAQERSLFLSLQSFAVSMTNPGQGLQLAQQAVDVLPPDDRSVFLANAQLTLAQLIAHAERFREAAELFHSSYLLFSGRKLHFPAAIALTNEALNRYRLGQMAETVELCDRALLEHSTFGGGREDFWYVLHLPLGMCYYELDKPSLALEHLRRAKSAIDALEMLHVHGLIEQYLFRTHALLGDTAAMRAIVQDVEAQFRPLHYRQMELFCCALKVELGLLDPSMPIQPEVERLELEYAKGADKCPLTVLAALTRLRLAGRSDAVTASALADALARLRFTGLLPQLQEFLILMAELHQQEGRERDALACLKDAAAIYDEHRMCAAFRACGTGTLPLLGQAHKDLHRRVAPQAAPGALAAERLLSPKEREVLALIQQGMTNEEMGKKLFIGVGTVKWHVNHIFAKLGAKNRVQAIERAKQLGEL